MNKYERLLYLLVTIRRADMPNRLDLYDRIVDVEIIYEDAIADKLSIHWTPEEVRYLQLEKRIRILENKLEEK